MITHRLLQLSTRTAVRKNDTLRVSIPYKHARSVGVLFSVEDKQKHDAIKAFIKQLEADGKTVKVLEYLPVAKENYEFLFDFFTVKDLSFWGSIKSGDAEKFMDMPFDYLYCVDRVHNPLILHLLARSKARCRVGRFGENGHTYFELMIEQEGTIQSLIDSMYKYTRQLK